MTTLSSLLLVVLSLQIGPAPDATVPAYGVVTEVPAAIPANAAPDAVDAERPLIRDKGSVTLKEWESDVRNAFTSLHITALDTDAWFYVAEYFGLRAMLVLVLMSIAWTASGWSSSAVRVALLRVKFDETLSIFLSKLVRWGILLLVGMTCLNSFGIQTTGFAAVIGAAGLAIGLAFQGTLSNFAAGAMLLIFRPYKVGDSVVVAGNAGTVAEIELFTTALDTSDNRRVIIPNGSIFGAVIENHTANLVRRAEVLVGVAYSADIDQTRAALNRAVASVTLLAPERKVEVALLNLGASSVDWAVRGWAKREVLGDARQALLRAVKIELERSGIDIPFPQLQIHLDPQPAAETGRRAA